MDNDSLLVEVNAKKISRPRHSAVHARDYSAAVDREDAQLIAS